MSILEKSFGALPDGTAVKQYILSNADTQVSLISYGARVQKFVFQGTDIVLGYNKLEDYLADRSTYFGATIGRYGNRIRDGKFTLNGKEYTLACNEPNRGHLHGGINGFDNKVWGSMIIRDDEEPCVRFTFASPDGDEGYPGNLMVSVTYTLHTDNSLEIGYHAFSDKDTVMNLTNHSYFNLNGEGGEPITNIQVKMNCDAYLPVDEVMIPTGEVRDVTGTPFDFRKGKTIGQDLNKPDDQLTICGGYDHHFVLPSAGKLQEAVEAHSTTSGITLQAFTDQPGFQMYTGNFLATAAAKSGKSYEKYGGFALETQHCPDSPNHPDFPTTTLFANTHWHSTTLYKPAK